MIFASASSAGSSSPRGLPESSASEGSCHHPAAGVFPGRGKLNRAALLQHFERGVPEFQVQDFAFARQQIVVDAQPVERPQMAVDDGGRDDFRHLRRVAMALFDVFQRLRAQFEARFVFREKLRDARVEIPAEIIEFRGRGERAHFVERLRLEVQ